MKNPRVRALVVGGVSLAVIAALGSVWATSSVAADGPFTTAAATTGDVSQSYFATGTVSRDNVVDAAFSTTGTVKRVQVAVGDKVAAGDVLASLDTAELKLALLNAETELAGAKANLYSAEHPASASVPRGSGGGVTLPSVPSGGTGSGSGGGQQGGITAKDAAKLYEAIAALNVATLKWSNAETPTTCDLVYAAMLNANEQDPEPTAEPTEPTPTPTPTEPTPTPTATEPTPTPTPTEPTPTPTATEPTPTPTTTEPSTEPTTEGDVEQLALVVDDITLDDIKACGQARTDLLLANAVLADYYQQLLTTGTIVTEDDPPSSTPTPQPSATSGSSGTQQNVSTGSATKVTVSARAVASAEADVLRAEQAVEGAERSLADAELTAPTAGTVGALSLAVGDSASAGTVTIVGKGTATVSLEVPLATRALLTQGMAATITPAGSMASLTGSVGRINLLETSGTAGDSPTYTTTVVVEDPEMLLKDGAPAGVEIVTGTASAVVIVPVSAVTPTGPGTGTVQVVDSPSADAAELVEVSTGTVGVGRVEITKGLAAGQLVVLSDRTAALPTANLSSVRRATSGR